MLGHEVMCIAVYASVSMNFIKKKNLIDEVKFFMSVIEVL